MTDPDAEQSGEQQQSEWYDSTGIVADRTNIIINGLLSWAENDGVEKITRTNVEDAVRSLTPVDSDNTVDKYIRRVIQHGPFVGERGLWAIDWNRVYSGTEYATTDKGDSGE